MQITDGLIRLCPVPAGLRSALAGLYCLISKPELLSQMDIQHSRSQWHAAAYSAAAMAAAVNSCMLESGDISEQQSISISAHPSGDGGGGVLRFVGVRRRRRAGRVHSAEAAATCAGVACSKLVQQSAWPQKLERCRGCGCNMCRCCFSENVGLFGMCTQHHDGGGAGAVVPAFSCSTCWIALSSVM